MKSLGKKFNRLLLSSLSFITLTAFSHAQTYDRVISFGDSLTDNGNTFIVTGNPPAPYFNGRFSNGVTWAEILAGNIRPQTGPSGTMHNFTNAGLPGNVNFAFGGSRADNLPNANGPLPSLNSQIGGFLLSGGTYGANNLVTVWSGANDLFQTLSGTSPASIPGSAAAVGTGVRSIITAGGRNIIVFNLPDLGLAPQFLGGPGAAPATSLTQNYNTALSTEIRAAAVANPSANIIQIDAFSLIRYISANPAAFGLTNATQACLEVATCIAGTEAVRNSYAFWDGVHPTASMQLLISQVAALSAYYQRDLVVAASLGDLSLLSRKANLMRSFDTIARYRYGHKLSEKGEMSLNVLGDIWNSKTSGSRPGYAAHSEGGNIAYARALNSAFGVGGTLSYQFGSVSQGGLKYDTSSISGDAWLSWRNGGLFVNNAIGVSANRYANYKRTLGIGNLQNTASVNGRTVSLGSEVGYVKSFDNFSLTPLGRLVYAHSNLDAFTENGIVQPLAINSRSNSQFIGNAELRGDYKLNAINLHSLVGFEGVISSSGNSISGTLANNTAAIATTGLGTPKNAGVYWGAGFSGSIKSVNVGLDYRGSTSQHRVTGGIKISF